MGKEIEKLKTLNLFEVKAGENSKTIVVNGFNIAYANSAYLSSLYRTATTCSSFQGTGKSLSTVRTGNRIIVDFKFNYIYDAPLIKYRNASDIINNYKPCITLFKTKENNYILENIYGK